MVVVLDHVSFWSVIFQSWYRAVKQHFSISEPRMEVFYFSLKYQIVRFTQEVALFVVVCSPLVLLVLCLQESACWCARPEDLPEVIQVLMLPGSHTGNCFLFWGKLELISRYLGAWMGAFNSHRADKLNQVIGDLQPVPKCSFHSRKSNKNTNQIGAPQYFVFESLPIWKAVNLFFCYIPFFLVSVSPRNSKSCSEVCHHCWLPPLRLHLHVPEWVRLGLHYEKKLKRVLWGKKTSLFTALGTHLMHDHRPTNGTGLGASSSLRCIMWMERRKRSTLENLAWCERDFFCSPYPLSATETGTEAVLSAASEIGSTAIVFVVTPAALLGLAC